jgi:predicted Fe-S protein YdhL (DUF1289 family)
MAADGGAVTITSPCIDLCKLGKRTRLCLGSARTVEEITRWRHLTEAQRMAIMAVLPDRRALLAGDLP